MDYRDGFKSIDKTDWIRKLEDIRKNRILSYVELAKEIGIGYNTLCSFLDTFEDKRAAYPTTIRKIDDYIKLHGDK